MVVLLSLEFGRSDNGFQRSELIDFCHISNSIPGPALFLNGQMNIKVLKLRISLFSPLTIENSF